MKAQIQAIKDSMVQSVAAKYFEFIQSINALPSDPFKKHTSFVRFDEGMMWMKEAILCAQFELTSTEAPLENAPSTESPAPGEEIRESLPESQGTESFASADVAPDAPTA
jgi:hypothetical protein